MPGGHVERKIGANRRDRSKQESIGYQAQFFFEPVRDRTQTDSLKPWRKSSLRDVTIWLSHPGSCAPTAIFEQFGVTEQHWR